MACAVPSLFVYCVQTCPLRAFFRRAQALRATAAASLCLRAFHAPVQMRAAYSELYRMQIDRPRARWWCSAHSSARVNAIKVARLEVIVLTCGVAMVICPAIWKMHRPASTATHPYPPGGGDAYFLVQMYLLSCTNLDTGICAYPKRIVVVTLVYQTDISMYQGRRRESRIRYKS